MVFFSITGGFQNTETVKNYFTYEGEICKNN